MADRSLYQQILGEEYLNLARPIRDLHSLVGVRKYRGICQVKGGSNIAARMLAKMMGLPKAGKDRSLTVEFKHLNGKELWIRHFDGKPFYSEQLQVGDFLHEKVSFITLAFQLEVAKGALNLALREIYFLGLPILTLCRFKVEASEWEEAGRFNLEVMVKAPFIGRIIQYRGWLMADDVLITV